MNDLTRGDHQDSQNANKEFTIQKIYTKDLSFETPSSPQIFREKWEPDVNVQLGTTTAVLDAQYAVHEVVLSVTVTAKLGEKTAFLVEVQQAGIFTMRGYTTDELGMLVGSFCPNVLFPFARETVSDLVTRGGFPQLLLAPVNFDALYQQHLHNQREQLTPQQPALKH
ncbi:MAG: protein-export chaperone SecB [Gammaproteobacteria bacterium]|nr:protein-export chaperone SecB [Gammaproteobacteria bacterium]